MVVQVILRRVRCSATGSPRCSGSGGCSLPDAFSLVYLFLAMCTMGVVAAAFIAGQLVGVRFAPLAAAAMAAYAMAAAITGVGHICRPAGNLDRPRWHRPVRSLVCGRASDHSLGGGGSAGACRPDAGDSRVSDRACRALGPARGARGTTQGCDAMAGRAWRIRAWATPPMLLAVTGYVNPRELASCRRAASGS